MSATCRAEGAVEDRRARRVCGGEVTTIRWRRWSAHAQRAIVRDLARRCWSCGGGATIRALLGHAELDGARRRVSASLSGSSGAARRAIAASPGWRRIAGDDHARRDAGAVEAGRLEGAGGGSSRRGSTIASAAAAADRRRPARVRRRRAGPRRARARRAKPSTPRMALEGHPPGRSSKRRLTPAVRTALFVRRMSSVQAVDRYVPPARARRRR